MSCSGLVESVETLQTRLAAARAAYDRLLTGKAARVVVDQNGERIEFTSVSASSLGAYIARLQSEIATRLGCPQIAPRPIGFVF